jgi:uncharacterized membrane protein
LFHGGPYLLRTILAGFVVLLILLVVLALFLVPSAIAMLLVGPNDPVTIAIFCGGLVLYVIPYTYVLLTVSPFMYLIVDRNVGALESLSLARTVVAENRLHLFLVWILGLLIYLAVFLACCVGALFTLPLFTLALTVAYLSMTGQPTIESFARPLGPTPVG